jgi:hypothetical protein
MSGAINTNREDKTNLTNITRLNGSVADITTSLMIITYGILNKTTIICQVVTRDSQEPQSSSTLYLTASRHPLLHTKRRRYISQQY